ncbi:NAD(P)/FAD-dependent oxidoreductase [Nocardiopsis sp. CNT312]|uniref:NAD(P)/FAD-dependent oxidoreductase n=1 Tax=Nocardiopsis sp. CNT312 TaxID=1137268 RepID=UPI00048DD17A|nr:NAD(P)/FAD-dependent oxidoreductase [Nocardiopsis sp. CNT312]
MSTRHGVDVAVIGGGAAGLSAAVTLARSLRSVVVVDGGEPRNAPAAGAHNVLGHEGIAPRDLLTAGRAEADRYGARFHDGRAVAARHCEGAFEVDLDDGGTLRARRILLATGLVDELPDVPGVRDLWGTDVLHCPYCHGWEVRGRRIGVLGTSELSLHQALMFRQLSEHVTLFTHTMGSPEDQAWEQMAALDVQVVEGPVRMLSTEGGRLRAVVLAEGHAFPVDAVAVAPRFTARTDLYEQLGGAAADHPMGSFIATGPMGRTDVEGVWAAGNAADLSAMVSVSTGAGVAAAAAINADLVAQDARAAVRARRAAAS